MVDYIMNVGLVYIILFKMKRTSFLELACAGQFPASVKGRRFVQYWRLVKEDNDGKAGSMYYNCYKAQPD